MLSQTQECFQFIFFMLAHWGGVRAYTTNHKHYTERFSYQMSPQPWHGLFVFKLNQFFFCVGGVLLVTRSSPFSIEIKTIKIVGVIFIACPIVVGTILEFSTICQQMERKRNSILCWGWGKRDPWTVGFPGGYLGSYRIVTFFCKIQTISKQILFSQPNFKKKKTPKCSFGIIENHQMEIENKTNS